MKSVFIVLIFALNSFAFQIDQSVIIENYIRNSLDNQSPFADSKCATRYDLEVKDQKDKIDQVLYERYMQSTSFEPVRELSLVTESGYFELHWDNNGTHAVPQEDISGNGIPDFIDSAEVILDHVYNVEVEQLGYLPPPGVDGNPAKPYHIYFTNQFAYGITRKGDLIQENLPDTSFASYIEMDNDFAEYYFPTKGLDGLKVTAAHEFHHAIQFGYGFRNSDVYFFEMTSTWMEEYIYPQINDYLYYLDYLFKVVSNSRFDLNSLTYPYANSLYLQMVEAQFDASIIKSVWDKMRTIKSLPALISTLEENSTTWHQSLTEYGLWLYYTGGRAMTDQFFKDAALFPEITIKSEDKIEFEAAYVDDVDITEIANRYMELQDVRGNILEILVSANDYFDAGYRMMTAHSYSQSYEMNTKNTTEPVDSEQLILVLTNSEEDKITSTLNAAISGTIDLTSIYAFPNPATISTEGVVRFQNVPPEADLNIFNVAGKRVASVENQGSSRIRSWRLVNDDGENVAAGVYFYLVQGDGLTKQGKFALVR